MAETAIAKKTFPQLIEQLKPQIALALPKHLSADKMARIALTELRRNPKLAECDANSVMASIIIASQLGLEPGVMGDGWLIPYRGECQFVPGYQGLIKLVRNGGMVKSLEAHVVYANEKFEYRAGLETALTHEPLLDGDPGEPRLAYAVAHLNGGGIQVEVMSRFQIERIRNRSTGYQAAKKWKKETPWETDEAEMWRKTVTRRIVKMLPKSSELSLALALEDAAHRGAQKVEIQEAIEGTWVPPADDQRQIAEGDHSAIDAINAEVKNGEAPGLDLGYSERP